MLEELRKINYRDGKQGLLYFLCEVIGTHSVSIRDAEIICSHNPGNSTCSVSEIVGYCVEFGWIRRSENLLSIDDSIQPYVSDKNQLNKALIESSLKQLFEAEIFNSDMFFYDSVQSCYGFRNENLPLHFSCVRDVLLSQGFLAVQRNVIGRKFFVEAAYESYIAKYCKKQRKILTLERLKKQIEANEVAGEAAEEFVLSYEKKRIGLPLCNRIKRISEIDVTAGYDIVSFDSPESNEWDRLIEVKAVSKSGFFWSRNEYEIAKLKGDRYYIYLVELSKTQSQNYSPEIIQNPADKIMLSDEWLVESQTFSVKRV